MFDHPLKMLFKVNRYWGTKIKEWWLALSVAILWAKTNGGGGLGSGVWKTILSVNGDTVKNTGCEIVEMDELHVNRAGLE